MAQQQNQPRLSNGKPTTGELSPWDLALARCLDLATAQTGKELTEIETEFWKETLQNQPIGGMEWAFREYLRQSSGYFPKPVEITNLIRSWNENVWSEKNKRRFVPCSQCNEGWISVHSGLTAGGNQVDPRFGARLRCECWQRYQSGLPTEQPAYHDQDDPRFGAGDMLTLWRMVQAKVAEVGGRKLHEYERTALIDELVEKKRMAGAA